MSVTCRAELRISLEELHKLLGLPESVHINVVSPSDPHSYAFSIWLTQKVPDNVVGVLWGAGRHEVAYRTNLAKLHLRIREFGGRHD